MNQAVEAIGSLAGALARPARHASGDIRLLHSAFKVAGRRAKNPWGKAAATV
jgi:hypothetical protein